MQVSPAPTWALSRTASSCSKGPVLTTDDVRVRGHHHLLGIRAAGASEWHPLTLTPRRPSRTEKAGIADMAAETSPRGVRGGARPPVGGEAREGARPGRPAPGQEERLLLAAEELFGRAQLPPDHGRRHLRPGRDGHRQLLLLLRLQGGDLRRRGPGHQRRPAAGHEGGPGAHRGRPAGPGARRLPGVLRHAVSARPWIDRIVRESEFIDHGPVPRVLRAPGPRLRARRACRPAGPRGRRALRSRGHRVRLHRHRQLRRHALGRLDGGRPGSRRRARRRARTAGPGPGSATRETRLPDPRCGQPCGRACGHAVRWGIAQGSSG